MSRRLLIIDDVASNRIVLKAKLMAAGYAVDLAADMAGAQAAIQSRLPDVALISASLRDPDARYLPKLLNARQAARRVPVIILDGGLDPVTPGDHVDAVLSMPANDSLMLARLRSAIRVRDLEDELRMRASTCRELGMAEDPETYKKLPHVLLAPRTVDAGVVLADQLRLGAVARITVLPVKGLVDSLERRGPADVVVLDANPENPAADLPFLSDLRCRAETRHAAIIMRLPAGAETEAGMALDLGASDVVIGKSDPTALRALVQRQIARQQKLQGLRTQVQNGLRLAATDALTGLYNRRYALSHMERLVARSGETGRALAVMVLDIDRFKLVNDTYGHQTGDTVLRAVATTLADNLRSADMLARYGGEEFLITMPDTTVDQARRAAERLCRKVAALRVAQEDAPPIGVTLSIGLAVRNSAGEPASSFAERLIRDADHALYTAKNDGRNQVTISRSAA